MQIVKKSIPVIYFIALFVVSGVGMLLLYLNPRKEIERVPDRNLVYQVYKSHEYKLTKPFLLMDLFGEDRSFIDLKNSIQNIINQEKGSGKLESASVYVKKFGGGRWFSVNPDVQYSPGSVMKIVTLLTYLREAEINPSIMDKKLNFVSHYSETPVQTIISRPLQPGKSYTIKELLNSMIIDSDNDATVLLNNNANMDLYFNLLRDLNLNVPDKNQDDYPLTVIQCSMFFRLLYASTFLSPEMSEYALDLLTKSTFKDGIVKSLPPDIRVAHKFGERNYDNNFQLHETGIVYFDDSPYEITIMTKGNEQAELSKVIDEVSNMVYDYMKNIKS